MPNVYRPEGYLKNLPQNREYISSREGLERACREGRILESNVIFCDSNMRLCVELGSMRGIIDRSEALYCRPGEIGKDIAIISRVGKPVCFKVTGFENEGGECVALLSRRLAQEECNRTFISALRAGDIIDATVTHLESFGAFVDIGCGLSSLLTVDSISVSRISHPRDRLSVGQSIHVVVKSVERESDRVYVSMRELLGTWEENREGFEVGQTVSGIVRSIESYGVFIELAPNLAGLAELKEGFEPCDSSLIGKPCAVYIKSIIPDRMKIKLVLIDAYRADSAAPSAQSFRYFVDCEKVRHMSAWHYSPKQSSKRIESIFED